MSKYPPPPRGNPAVMWGCVFLWLFLWIFAGAIWLAAKIGAWLGSVIGV